jgi:hypothetical protein
MERSHKKLVQHMVLMQTGFSAPTEVASMDAINSLIPCHAITPLVQHKSNSQGAQQVMFHASLLSLAAIIPFPKISMLRMVFVSAFSLTGYMKLSMALHFNPNKSTTLWHSVLGF